MAAKNTNSKNKDEDKLPWCFIMTPIGEIGSEIRKRSDQVLKHIIKPATIECGYKPIRADEISNPGIITSQVIKHIIEDPMAVVDLTGWNPNVFYELALRHMVRKPFVQLISDQESLPFDVNQSRTIKFNHQDLDSAEAARQEIIEQIKAIQANPDDLVDNPISNAIDLIALKGSNKPLEQTMAEILETVQNLSSQRYVGDMWGSVHSSESGSVVGNSLLDPVFRHLYQSLRNQVIHGVTSDGNPFPFTPHKDSTQRKDDPSAQLVPE